MLSALAMAGVSLGTIVPSRKWLGVMAVVLTIIPDSTCPRAPDMPAPGNGGKRPIWHVEVAAG